MPRIANRKTDRERERERKKRRTELEYIWFLRSILGMNRSACICNAPNTDTLRVCELLKSNVYAVVMIGEQIRWIIDADRKRQYFMRKRKHNGAMNEWKANRCFRWVRLLRKLIAPPGQFIFWCFFFPAFAFVTVCRGTMTGRSNKSSASHMQMDPQHSRNMLRSMANRSFCFRFERFSSTSHTQLTVPQRTHYTDTHTPGHKIAIILHLSTVVRPFVHFTIFTIHFNLCKSILPVSHSKLWKFMGDWYQLRHVWGHSYRHKFRSVQFRRAHDEPSNCVKRDTARGSHADIQHFSLFMRPFLLLLLLLFISVFVFVSLAFARFFMSRGCCPCTFVAISHIRWERRNPLNAMIIITSGSYEMSCLFYPSLSVWTHICGWTIPNLTANTTEIVSEPKKERERERRREYALRSMGITRSNFRSTIPYRW